MHEGAGDSFTFFSQKELTLNLMPYQPVLIVPGLGDDGAALEVATRFWENHGLVPRVHVFGWGDSVRTFSEKMEKLHEAIDEAAGQGTVALVGCSAGASAVLNAYLQERKKVSAVVNVCGMLRPSAREPAEKFRLRTDTSPLYRQSVLLFAQNEPSLSLEDRGRIMTVRAFFGDQHIPSDTVALEGAYNTVIPSVRHVLSIALALTLFSRPMLDFLGKSA